MKWAHFPYRLIEVVQTTQIVCINNNIFFFFTADTIDMFDLRSNEKEPNFHSLKNTLLHSTFRSITNERSAALNSLFLLN